MIEGGLMTTVDDTTYLEEKRELCSEYGVDFNKIKEFHSRIAPLIRNIAKKDAISSQLNEAYKEVRRSLEYWREIWVLATSKVSSKQKSLLELFMYLELSEGVFDELIQVITFVLMSNHHDLYDPRTKVFLESYRELEGLDFYVKLQFIERHGFEFVSGAFDRKLRNCIAHLDFIINDDGTIVKRKTGEKMGDIMAKMHYLGTLCSMMIIIVNKVLSEDPRIHFEKREIRF
jgi:hypothetical protein